MGLTNLTCLNVSDVAKSAKWYQVALGFQEIARKETAEYVSRFVACDGDPEKEISKRQGLIELRQLKAPQGAKIYNGNTDPYRGFGHLCVSVANIAEAQKHLLKEGIEFKKKLEDGRQHNIIFIVDPDTYWVELIENQLAPESKSYDVKYNRLNHTMIRVKDPQKSLDFYLGKLGMKLVSKKAFPEAKFSVYFLGYVDTKGDEDVFGLQASRESLLELTHNYGTESDDSHYYVFGQDKNVIGFDHLGVSVSDPEDFISSTAAKPVTGADGSVIIEDPDGWKVRLSKL